MNKILILHDLDSVNMNERFADREDKYTVFTPSPVVKPCVGCFGCWVKTPGRCVISDDDSLFAESMAHHEKVIIISRLVFGGLSPNVKAVLDRSIGYILPYFRIVDGEMHHVQRYPKKLTLSYMFYGENLPENEKTTAGKLAKGNALNLGADDYTVDFYDSADVVLEELD